MPAEHGQRITLKADLNDAYDGVIRMLIDAQRFGFALRGLAVTAEPGRAPVAEITLDVPAVADAGDIAQRLMRHPAVIEVKPLPSAAANDTGARTQAAAGA